MILITNRSPSAPDTTTVAGSLRPSRVPEPEPVPAVFANFANFASSAGSDVRHKRSPARTLEKSI